MIDYCYKQSSVGVYWDVCKAELKIYVFYRKLLWNKGIGTRVKFVKMK